MSVNRYLCAVIALLCNTNIIKVSKLYTILFTKNLIIIIDQMYVGKRLKGLLEEKKLTQKALMEYMGWKQANSVTNFMTGNPTAESLDKVASFLGVSVAAFFDEGTRGPVASMSGNKNNQNSFNGAQGIDAALALLKQSLDASTMAYQRAHEANQRLIAEYDEKLAQLRAELARRDPAK